MTKSIFNFNALNFACAFFACKNPSPLIYHIHIVYKSWDPYPTFWNQNYKNLTFSKIKVFTLDDTCSDVQIAFNVQSWSRRALKPHSTSIILKDNLIHHKFFVRMLNPCTYAYSYPLIKGQFFPLHQGHKESVFPSL